MYGALPFRLYDEVEERDEFREQIIQQDAKLQEDKQKLSRGSLVFLVILAVFSVTGVLAFFNSSTTVATLYSGATTLDIAPEKSLLLYITAENEYGQYGGKYSWLNDVEGSQLVEPYKTTTLTAGGPKVASSNGYSWTWTTSYDDTVYTGSSIDIVFTKTGVFSVTLTGKSSTMDDVTFTTNLISKYVKRELRSLSDDDRAAFVGAAHKMWKYDDETGREKYGDKFTSMATFVEEHALASNDVKCDQFHEGSGFFTHHFALSQAFEASLRAINPAVTLPYWDFTIEGQAIEDAGQNPSYFLEITPFFTDDWFGEVDGNNHIINSKFAGASMPKVNDDSIVSPNSYGYIRSYWNNNNDDEVTRHFFDVCGVEPTRKTIPSCSTHYDVMDTKSLAKFQILSPSDGHGPLHVQFGGIYGDCIQGYQDFITKWSDVLNADMTTDEINSIGYDPKTWEFGLTGSPRLQMIEKEVMGEYFHIYRSLWRSHMCSRDGTPNLLTCPESCADDASTSECKCQVEGLDDGTTDWEDVYNCVLSSEKNRNLFNAVFSSEFLEDLVKFVSTTSIYEGEMLEAASPADITFWVIHPTIERLLAAKRNTEVTDFGGMSFTEWSPRDGNSEEWYSYSYYTLEENENSFWPEAYTCVGHADTDPALPSALQWLDGFEELADTDGDGTISNWEYYVAMDPNNVNGVDYVFDSFEWSHCDGVVDSTR